MIAGILCVVSFAHIVLYGINTINKNIYEIGVLKALGTKVFDIGRIFIVQIALIGLGVSILSILGIYSVSMLTNNLLIIALSVIILACLAVKIKDGISYFFSTTSSLEIFSK